MNKLIQGAQRFQSENYPKQKPLFDELASGQSPETLFITCSDSRIDPNLITQTAPGELFVIRNAGNIVPPYCSSHGGEEPTIEYAVDGLKVKNIVVCGHAHCGAMGALLNKSSLTTMPAVEKWLDHAEGTLRRLGGDNNVEQAIEHNVLVQADNLKSHPCVSAALLQRRVNIYGWVYHFDKGTITMYDVPNRRFVPISELNEKTDYSQFEL